MPTGTVEIRSTPLASRTFAVRAPLTNSEMHDLVADLFAPLEDYSGGYYIVGGQHRPGGWTEVTVVAWVASYFADLFPDLNKVGVA